ncbi:MAG: hypothetical protein LBO02_01255 [Holosporaceae bacterium]|jgi:hypothetical protein|nr:hypothetical protein [Holosporaceae bacterium]
MKKFSLIFFLVTCSRYETPDLPDLDRKSFSSEKFLQQQKELMAKIKKINQDNGRQREE